MKQEHYIINGEKLYGIKELARILGVSTGKIRNCMYRGMTPRRGLPPITLEKWKTIGGIKSSLEAVDRFHMSLAKAAEQSIES